MNNSIKVNSMTMWYMILLYLKMSMVLVGKKTINYQGNLI